MTRYKGNALAEYGVMGSLVAIVTVTGLTLMGNNFNDLVQEAHARMENTANAAVVAAETANSPAGGGEQMAGLPAGVQNGQLCFSDNNCVSVPLDANGNYIIETAGSNGHNMTTQYAETLKQMANALKNDPNADPAYIDLITKLANQGHHLAGSEQITEQNYKKYCIEQQLNCGQATYNEVEQCTTFSSYFQTQQEADEFAALYQQLQKYSSSNPNAIPAEIMHAVDNSAQNILTIASAYETGTREDGTNWVAELEFVINGGTAGSTQTTGESNNICANGGSWPDCSR